MGLSIDTGVLTMRTTDGDDTIALVDQDANAFAGKALFIWATLNASNGAFTADAIMAWGMSDGNNHGSGLGEFSWCNCIQDNVVTSNTNRRYANKALVLADNTGALLATATAAWSGNNLVLTWDWAVAGTAYLIHWLVLGGTDLQNARVINSFQAHTTTSGTSVDYTGFGFAPDFACFATAGDENAAPNGRANASCSIGFAANKASRKSLWMWQGEEDALATEAAYSYFSYDDTAFAGAGTPISLEHKAFKTGTPTNNGVVEVTAWLSDGLTAKWWTKAGNAWYFAIFAFKGLQYDIHLDLCPTSTGVDTQTGVGFQPKGLLSFMSNVTTGNVASLDVSLGIGACTTSSDHHSCWYGSDDGVATSQANMRSSIAGHVLRADPTTPTADVFASFTGFVADGFEQNFTTVPATAAYQGWVAFGAASAATNRRRLLAQAF